MRNPNLKSPLEMWMTAKGGQWPVVGEVKVSKLLRSVTSYSIFLITSNGFLPYKYN
jgi:hypothetical protein